MIRDAIMHWSSDSDPVVMPIVIAEAGVNHEGSVAQAKYLIEAAASAGADAIKFQTYKADKLASRNSPAYWDLQQEPTKTQHALFQKYDSFELADYQTLKEHCVKHQIEFLSTPFDLESAEFLNEMMSVFKISSSDITNKPFIQEVSRFGKPIILSTGAANLDEIDSAIRWINDRVPIALLHCVLSYPTEDENANLGMISGLQKVYPDRMIGYSDHTMASGMETLEIATLLGARILEKHFTHDKGLPGNDHYHAMDADDLKCFRKNIQRSLNKIGTFQKKALAVEQSARENARRSLVASRNLNKGDIIGEKDVTWKRPANGICPSFINSVINRRLRISIKEDDLLTWDLLE